MFDGFVGGEDHLQRCLGLVRNAAEHEPFFLMLAALWGYTAVPPAWALLAIRYFAPLRVCHALAYLVGNQPFRTLFYLPTLFATLGMAVMILVNSGAGGAGKTDL